MRDIKNNYSFVFLAPTIKGLDIKALNRDSDFINSYLFDSREGGKLCTLASIIDNEYYDPNTGILKYYTKDLYPVLKFVFKPDCYDKTLQYFKDCYDKIVDLYYKDGENTIVSVQLDCIEDCNLFLLSKYSLFSSSTKHAIEDKCGKYLYDTNSVNPKHNSLNPAYKAIYPNAKIRGEVADRFNVAVAYVDEVFQAVSIEKEYYNLNP